MVPNKCITRISPSPLSPSRPRIGSTWEHGPSGFPRWYGVVRYASLEGLTACHLDRPGGSVRLVFGFRRDWLRYSLLPYVLGGKCQRSPATRQPSWKHLVSD